MVGEAGGDPDRGHMVGEAGGDPDRGHMVGEAGGDPDRGCSDWTWLPQGCSGG
jgi:hypothetical protein